MSKTLSDTIIKEFPKVYSSKVDYVPISSNCNKLETNKNDILKINDIYYKNISDIVSYIGSEQRYSYPDTIETKENIHRFVDQEIRQFHIHNSELGKSCLKKIKELINNTHINVNLYEYGNDFYLEKKIILADNSIKKTYVKILNVELLGTGDLSFSLILKILYAYNDEGKIKTKEMCIKVYPLDIGDYYPLFSQNMKSDIHDIYKYIVIREGLVGCWVNNNLLVKKLFRYPVTNTIMSVSDVYFVKGKKLNMGKHLENGNGLPFKYDELMLQNYDLVENKKKRGKKWLNENLIKQNDWETKISPKEYGYIEMEVVKYTLGYLIDKQEFNLDLLFEIIYTKLCLNIIGNVYTVDDHRDNIMVVPCTKVRQYIIKCRNTEYNFFIDYKYKIKFIDLERVKIYENRNILFHNTAFERYYFDSHPTAGIEAYNTGFVAEQVVYADVIMKNIFKQKCTIDAICDILVKYLPSQYTSIVGNTGVNIEKYYLDLDKPDSELLEYMLIKPEPTHIPRYPYYKSWSGILEFPPVV
jgi:hypothetical protein